MRTLLILLLFAIPCMADDYVYEYPVEVDIDYIQYNIYNDTILTDTSVIYIKSICILNNGCTMTVTMANGMSDTDKTRLDTIASDTQGTMAVATTANDTNVAMSYYSLRSYDTEVNTTSTAFVDIDTFITDPFETGRYRVLLALHWQISNANSELAIRISEDNTPLHVDTFSAHNAMTGDEFIGHINVFLVDLTEVHEHEFQMEYRRAGQTGTVSLREIKFEIFKVRDL